MDPKFQPVKVGWEKDFVVVVLTHPGLGAFLQGGELPSLSIREVISHLGRTKAPE